MGEGGGKTPLALVLDACALLGIRDPMDFYQLSPQLQDLWVEHARNTWTGAYERTPKRGRGGGGTPGSAALERELIEARARDGT